MRLRAAVMGIAIGLLTATSVLVADAQPPQRRLFYVGLALYSETWSQNDVVALSDELQRSSDFSVVPLIASNFTPARQYPIADDARIAALLRTAAMRAAPDDLVVVHISTHGAPGLLASRIGNRQTTAITARSLAHLLAPLSGHDTVVIVSACYSGSLIGALQAPDRIVIAAARADRSSFGCAAGARHTFFGNAELEAFAERHRSLRQVFTAIRDDVAQMEREQDYRPPSEPQVWVGGEVRDLYDAPLF
jgi:peptidase C13-like protein